MLLKRFQASFRETPTAYYQRPIFARSSNVILFPQDKAIPAELGHSVGSGEPLASSCAQKGARVLSKLLFTGGTVVTASGSYEADVLVEDEKIVAVGTRAGRERGTEEVDASGKLVMPGFIDAHTHMDMPFGGTMTADDWATGTEAAAAGGTTMIIDFALQEEGGTLAGAFDAWTEKSRDKAVIDYSFHVAITDLRDDIKSELPSLAEKGVASVKIFMAYKGTPLYSEDEDLFETLQLSTGRRRAGHGSRRER